MHKSLKPYFSKYNLNAVLITDLINVRYLSGFAGTNGFLLITKKQNCLLTDFRYIDQAKKQAPGFKVIDIQKGLSETIIKLLRPAGSPPPLSKGRSVASGDRVRLPSVSLGFESSKMTHFQHAFFKKHLKGIKLIPIPEDTAKIREVKSAIEIKKLQKALQINKLAFEEIRPKIKPGLKESEVALMLELALRKHGAEKLAFDTIVASGWRGALPHGLASNKKLKNGELVTIDFGALYQGYHADETVTFIVGEKRDLSPALSFAKEREATTPLHRSGGGRGRTGQSHPLLQGEGRVRSRQLAIWQTVYYAQQIAIKFAKPGVKCSEIDKVARDYITSKGYGKYFGHSLGHGVGLEIHEKPTLGRNSNDILKPGMVFTIEPGIYIPKFGGVRIEDVFVCTENGIRKISKIKKNL